MSITGVSKRVPVDEYVDRISDIHLKVAVFDLFMCLGNFGALTHGWNPSTWESITVRGSNEIDAYTVFGQVVLSTGLIEYAVNLKLLEADCGLINSRFSIPDGGASPSQNFFNWAVSHELVHIERKHSDVAASAGADTMTSRALEMDADKVAVARLFRWNQGLFGGNASALGIKCLLLRDLHLGIRGLPDPSGDSTHVSSFGRMFDISLKLATLREDPRNAPDRECNTPETLSCIEILRELFFTLEKLRIARLGIDRKEYREMVVNFFDTLASGDHGARWDELRELVAAKSGRAA